MTKMDRGEQARERPVPHSIEDTIKEQKQDNMKSEMKKQRATEADTISEVGTKWNIGVDPDHLTALMSKMSLAQGEKEGGVLGRLVRRALARAAPAEAKELGTLATKRCKEEFLIQLRKMLEKTSGKGCETQTKSKVSNVSERLTTQKTTEPAKVQTCDEAKKKKKKSVLEELKEDNDLCPRSPMRPHHHRTNNYLPYQNASRDNHSGGIMSTVAYSDPIAPTPQYTFQSMLPSASSPPLVMGSSSAPCADLEDLDDIIFTEMDVEFFMSYVANSCIKQPIYSEEQPLDSEEPPLPKVVDEINSSQYDASTNFSTNLDHQVPTNMSTTQNIVDDLFLCNENLAPVSPPWEGYYDDSTSGCSSLSPDSVTSSCAGGLSPDSRRIVPDESDARSLMLNMSPPTQFFEDNTKYDLNVNVYAKDAGYCDAGFSPASSGYSSTNTPSPTDYPLANVHDPNLEDFETSMRNDFFSPLDFPLPKFENVFDADTLNECSQTNLVTNSYNPSYTENIATSTLVYSPSENTNYHSSAHIPCSNTLNNVPDLTQEVINMSTTFTTLVNVSPNIPVQSSQSYAGADSTPVTVNAGNIQRAMPVTKTNLKRLEPKVEPLLRTETGRERVLQLMDPIKKADAWIRVSLKVKEITETDVDGDTQLMILCANPKGNKVLEHILEYIYALVETLKGIPGALSAVNHQQQSALYLAALHSNYANRAIVVRYIAETLVEMGEDIAHTSKGGDTILHQVCQQGDQRYDVLVELLSLKTQAGQPYFDVNQYNAKGLTPLHIAVLSHGANNVICLKTVQLLVAVRADISMPETTHSYTALHLAIILTPCAPRLIKALLRGGNSAASVCVNNTLNNKRDSPLHCAASRNDLPVKQQMSVIQLLLEHGAVKSLNASGKFPIALVAEGRREEIRRVYETRKGNVGMS